MIMEIQFDIHEMYFSEGNLTRGEDFPRASNLRTDQNKFEGFVLLSLFV